MKKVSIIIPCREIDELTEKCIHECLKLDYDNFEILVMPDSHNKKNRFNKKVIIIETGKVRPALKRNIGMKKAKGKFFAFIDSDAYPEKNWLKNAVKYFDDEKIGIVGGPNLTPPDGNFWEHVSGYTLSNFFVSGFANIRYKIAKNQYSKELPSSNYISRRGASSDYKPDFLTAEDSEFCFECKRRGYKILYAGDIIVYHHRRNSFAGHINQIWIYGRDIAWLTRENFSLNYVYYAILSIFSVGFVSFMTGSFFSEIIRLIFLYSLGVYFLIMFITSIHKNIKTTLAVTITSILIHFTYGFGWIYGMLSKKKSKIGKR